MSMTLLALALGCRGEPEAGAGLLDPVDHAIRASMAVRGVRPSAAELRRVRARPAEVEVLVDEWLRSDAFGETIKDMHAEWLLVRADVIEPLPALGPLEGRLLHEMSRSPSEAPLELVKHVVTQDLPYTQVVTADYTVADEIVAAMYGLDYDPAGPEWQVTHWADSRPTAGLLSDSELWRRHESAGSNFNRLRANLVADVFLCSDFASRDIVVEGGITISDEFQVADAVRNQTECVNCHQALDPLAAYFFGFKKQTRRSTVRKGYDTDCDPAPMDDTYTPYSMSEYCYPLEIYSTEDEDWWQYWDLRPPGFYGAPGHDLVDLGAYIAADPRFAQCAGRRFFGWMTQTDPYELPLDQATELQQVLVDSGFDARALVRHIVLSDEFRAADLQIVRPEQLARTVEEWTGFTWLVDPDEPGCDVADKDGTDCWGQVDLMRSDLYGFRAMSGGINSSEITRPAHGPTPTRELVATELASLAAGHVVASDFAEPDRSRRRLLTAIDGDDVDEISVRTQLVVLAPTLLGTFPTPADPEIDALWDLFTDRIDAGGSSSDAWSLVLTAMMLDPRGLFY